MAKRNIIVFKTIDKEGKELELAVRKPTVENMIAGQDVYSRTYKEAVENGDFFRAALERHLIEQEIWDDEKQAQLEAYDKIIKEGEDALSKGKIKKSEAKNIAVAIKLARAARVDLLSERNQYNDITVEGKAENAKFNYWVSVCTVYNDTRNPYFGSLEDYLNRADEVASYDAAQNLASLIYGLDSDYESKLPENKFLKHFGYMNDKGEFIDAQGRRTDIFGRLLDEEGNYIDESGNKIVYEEPVIDFDSFLDDEDEQKIVDAKVEAEVATVQEKSVKRGRPKKSEVVEREVVESTVSD